MINLNLERFINFHLLHSSVTTVTVSQMQSPFAIVEVKEDHIVGFKEKTVLEDKLVSAGIHIFSHSILDYLLTVG